VGIHHPAEPVVFPDEYFSNAEIEILKNDPDLIVEPFVEDDVSGGSSLTGHLRLDPGGAPKNGNGQPGAAAGREGSGSNPVVEGSDDSQDDKVDELPVDDPERTRNCIHLIVGENDEVPSVEEIAAWSPEERTAVVEYCGAVHLSASDNPDVVIPDVPERLAVMFEQQARAREKIPKKKDKK
jgi:hypothetical protein